MKYALRALGRAMVTIVIASLIVFALLSLAPGDPAAALAGNRATPESIEAIREQLGLNRPLLVRYVAWLGGAIHGDFGQSLQFRQSVGSLLAPRLGTTLILVLFAFLLILIFGVGLGLLPSLFRPSGWFVVVVAGIGIAVPTFVAALVLIQVFALNLGWFPVLATSEGDLRDRVWHLTLPAIALALSWTAYVAQITRASVREQERGEHVETALSRGVPPRTVFRKHVLRNASVPIVTIAGLTMAGLIAGSIVVETAFGIGGIGSLLVKSVSAKDYDVVLAISLILVVAFVIATTLSDLAHAALDPRVRARRSS